MKQKTLLLFFLLLIQVVSAQTEWFASPTGTAMGDGSIANPWDLQTAFTNASNSIKPGHTLWLRGGVYRGQFDSYLQGTATQPITVQSYCGETAVLNGNTVYPTPLTPNPNPPLVNPNPGIQKRVRKFYWSLNPEEKSGFYEYARQNPNQSQNGLLLINLPKPAVLNVYGGYVYFKRFEITCLGNFSRDFNDNNLNFFNLEGINHRGGVNCKFLELIVYNNPGTGISSWKYTGGTEFLGCIVYNNGFYITPTPGNRGHGPGFYVQNISDDFRKFTKNIVFSNFYKGYEIWSENSTDPNDPLGLVDYVKNISVDNCTVFNASLLENTTPMNVNGTAMSVQTFRDNIMVASNSFSARNINIRNNILYHNIGIYNNNISYSSTSLNIGQTGNFYPTNINVENNIISGKNDVIRFSLAKSPFSFKNNIIWGHAVNVGAFNLTSLDCNNWNFENNQYYSKASDSPVGRLFLQSGNLPFNALTLSEWQALYNIDLNSTHFEAPEISNVRNRDIKVVQITPLKYYVTGLVYAGGNFTVNSFTGIPLNSSYIIRDVENCHQILSSGTFDGSPITFNMLSSGYENATGVTFNPNLKSPTNFGCFIIEFDLCSNTTATFTLPTQTCVTAGALTNLSQYVNNAPNTGTFTGVGVQQVGGEYIFNAAIAGLGTHTITYSYQVAGCCQSNSVSSTITVTNCVQKPYISQTYYNGTDKFIEIKNSSATQSINAGNYYLALYENNAATNVAPTKYINLGTIAPQGVKVWKAQAGGNLGYVTATDWLDLNDYDGVGDVIVLTTTIDANAYANRIDAFGKANFNAFNDNITLQQQASFVRMSCAPALPSAVYNQQDWVYFTAAEVASSTSKTNAELGRHFDKQLEFETSNTWNELDIPNPIPNENESLPDRSRSVYIRSDYNTSTFGSFEACSVKINELITLTISANTFVKVFVGIDATLPDAKLIVEDKGSLVQVYDCYYGTCGVDLINLGAQSALQVSKNTIELNSPYDYVHLSSPLANVIGNPTAQQVFNFGTGTGQFLPGRFYKFMNENWCDIYNRFDVPNYTTDAYDDNLDDYISIDDLGEESSPLKVGRLYATWPPVGGNGTDYNYTINYTGVMNNGELLVPVYKNNSLEGYNTNGIGNPYPSAIDLDYFFRVNQGKIIPAAFVYTRIGSIDFTDPSATYNGPWQIDYSGANFAIYYSGIDNNNPYDLLLNPGGYSAFPRVLASGQGFFVDIPKDSSGFTNMITSVNQIFNGTEPLSANVKHPQEEPNQIANYITFNNSMRTTMPNITFSRSVNPVNATTNHLDKLVLKLEDATGYNVLNAVLFSQSGTDAYNQMEDIRTPYGRRLNLYSICDYKELVINKLNAFTIEKIIPLGMMHAAYQNSGLVTLSIIEKGGVFENQTVYLLDSVTQQYHNLSAQAFSFTMNQNILEGRFSLVFTTNSVNFERKKAEDHLVQLALTENNLKIQTTNKKIKNVEVMDIYNLGTARTIAVQSNLNSNYYTQNISNSIKFINVTILLEDGTVINKKFSNQ